MRLPWPHCWLALHPSRSPYARAVAYNMFLDGNTSRDSLSVDRKPLLCDLQAGAALFLGRTRLSYTYVLRSKEFEGQPQMDRFGSVAISV